MALIPPVTSRAITPDGVSSSSVSPRSTSKRRAKGSLTSAPPCSAASEKTSREGRPSTNGTPPTCATDS